MVVLIGYQGHIVGGGGIFFCVENESIEHFKMFSVSENVACGGRHCFALGSVCWWIPREHLRV